MNAAGVAAALGDARREGSGWRCRCPVHGGQSLTLRDGDGGRLLVMCWPGCDRLDVLAELRARQLLGGADYAAPPHRDDACDDADRIARALRIWREARDSPGSPAARYLAGRGIVLDAWPVSLRYHPRCP